VAASFTGITSHPVTVILPSGAAATWNEYTATAQPSGVVFRFRLAPTAVNLSVVDGEATQWADAFNQKSLVSGVQSISTYQTVDAQNQIEDRLTVIVESDSGESTQELDLPQSYLQQTLFNDRVEAVREQLNAVEAL
jgi:hypothetical protein